jgi:hypothetical protein
MGINIRIFNWIMGCLNSALFVVFINGSPYHFFKAMRGLRQAFPLSPFLFLIVAEGLSRLMKEARNSNSIRWVKVSESEEITHLLFVDDIFLSVFASQTKLISLKKIIDLYCKVTGMMINLDKSNMILNNFSEGE